MTIRPDFPALSNETMNGNSEGIMKDKVVCPFYAKSDDFCDVGCGYISPYDVNMIIKYCSCRYNDCLKYQELAERFPSELINLVNC